ncbi:unnamed protein product [Leuciscus chuanchicus]
MRTKANYETLRFHPAGTLRLPLTCDERVYSTLTTKAKTQTGPSEEEEKRKIRVESWVRRSELDLGDPLGTGQSKQSRGASQAKPEEEGWMEQIIHEGGSGRLDGTRRGEAGWRLAGTRWSLAAEQNQWRRSGLETGWNQRG